MRTSVPIILGLLLLLAAPRPANTPDLRATWVGHERAQITWTQPDGLHCLWREAVLIGCGAEAGTYTALLAPGGDAAYVPHPGAVYVLETGGAVVGQAALPWQLWLPRAGGGS